MATTNEDIKVVIEAEAGQFKTQMKDVIADLQTAQKEVASFSKSIQKGFGDIKSILIEVVKDTNSMQKNMSKSLSSISNKSDGMGGSVQSAMDMSGKSMMKFGAIAGAVGAVVSKVIDLVVKAIKKVAELIKKVTEMAIDAVESETLVAIVFGESAGAIREWSDELADALGLNAYTLRKDTAMLYNISKGLGVTEKNALTLAKGFTQLSRDMSAFYNIPIEDAFTKLRSGITGETEPLRKLGVIITQTQVKSAAYRYGIAQVGDELSEQQKVLGRYMTVLEQTGTAQGAWAIEMQNPATQIKILTNRIKMVAIDLGSIFIPILQKVLPYLQAFVYVIGDAVKMLLDFLGLVGVDVSKNLQDIGSSADGATEGVKDLKSELLGLAAFDEMNVLKKDDGAGSGSGSGGGSGGFELPEYDMGMENIKDKAVALKDIIVRIFKDIWKKIKQILAPIISLWEKWVTPAIEGLKIQLGLLFSEIVDSPIGGILKAIAQILGVVIVGAIAVVIWVINGVIVIVRKLLESWKKRFNLAVEILARLILFFDDFGENIKEVLGNIGQWFTDVWEALGIIIDDFIKKIKKKIFDFIIKLIINWLILRNRVSEIWTDMMVNIKNKISRITSSVRAKVESIKSYFVGIWTTVKWVFQSIGNWMWSKISWAVSKVKGVLKSLKTGFSGFFVNIASSIKAPINWIIDRINNMIWTMNKWRIPKILPNGLNIGSIPRLAKGGVVSSPTLSMVGEAGREAVLPLDNNTQWMNELANKIGGKEGAINLRVDVGGEKLYEKTIKYIKDKSLATNTNLLGL